MTRPQASSAFRAKPTKFAPFPLERPKPCETPIPSGAPRGEGIQSLDRPLCALTHTGSARVPAVPADFCVFAIVPRTMIISSSIVVLTLFVPKTMALPTERVKGRHRRATAVEASAVSARRVVDDRAVIRAFTTGWADRRCVRLGVRLGLHVVFAHVAHGASLQAAWARTASVDAPRARPVPLWRPRPQLRRCHGVVGSDGTFTHGTPHHSPCAPLLPCRAFALS